LKASRDALKKYPAGGTNAAPFFATLDTATQALTTRQERPVCKQHC
jgi:hypothetical protein